MNGDPKNPFIPPISVCHQIPSHWISDMDANLCSSLQNTFQELGWDNDAFYSGFFVFALPLCVKCFNSVEIFKQIFVWIGFLIIFFPSASSSNLRHVDISLKSILESFAVFSVSSESFQVNLEPDLIHPRLILSVLT